MLHTFRPRTALAASAALLALAATACTSDDADDPAPGSPDTPSSDAPSEDAVPELTTSVTVRTVTGVLSTEAREHVRDRVVEAVDAWIDAAYVGGEYPRSDFDDAFPSFTPGAAARAEGDLDLMTNAGVGEQVDEVTARLREVKLDVLAHEGRPAAVTATFRLGLGLRGEIERTDRVRGRLLLTYTPGGWKIFGYDVERGEV